MDKQFVRPLEHINSDTWDGRQDHPHADDRKRGVALTEGTPARAIEAVAEDICPQQQPIYIPLPGDIKQNILLSFVCLRPVRDSAGKKDKIDLSLQCHVRSTVPEINLCRSAESGGQNPDCRQWPAGARRVKRRRHKRCGDASLDHLWDGKCDSRTNRGNIYILCQSKIAMDMAGLIQGQ